MATITEPRSTSGAPSAPKKTKGQVIVDWITTTDHKKIGYLYLITTFIWFLIGGLMALVIRAQLALPGLEIVQTKEQYNQLFTMHGTIMLLLFATPLFAGFANVIMPVQIGAPDVAFPRLNALSYWIFTFGGLIAVAGYFYPPGCRQLWLVCLRAAFEHNILSRYRWRLMGLWTGHGWFRNDPGCGELHHHHLGDACTWNDYVENANFQLEHTCHIYFGDHVFPTFGSSAVRSRS